MTTYATLQSDVALRMARSDLTSEIQSFIRIAEAGIRRKLRVRSMETTDDAFTISAQTMPLPSGFERMISVTLDGEIRPLDQLSANKIREAFIWTESGVPQAYSIEGDNIVFAPYSASTAVLVYFQALTTLTDPSHTNTVLTNHYDVYLYGALEAGYDHVRNEAESQKYGAKFDKVISELNRSNMQSRYGGSARIATGTPTP